MAEQTQPTQEHLQPLSPEAKAREELNQMVANPGFDQIASLYGTEELPEDKAQRLQALKDIADAHLDFRNGATRQEVKWGDEALDQADSPQHQAIFAAADSLGLLQDSRPRNKRPDNLIIRGGANKAPLDRLRYGIESVDDYGTLYYLASGRTLSDAEKAKAADYAPGAQNEFDLGCGALVTELQAAMVSEETINRNGDIWIIRRYEFEKDGVMKQAIALSTPPTIEGRRASTYDNNRFFAEVAGLDTNPNQSVVAVTTGFYVGGQHPPAVREITRVYGTKVETIGHSAEYSGVTRTAKQLLQETKNYIDALVRLQHALDGTA